MNWPDNYPLNVHESVIEVQSWKDIAIGGHFATNLVYGEANKNANEKFCTSHLNPKWRLVRSQGLSFIK